MNDLLYYLGFPFVRYALIVGVLIAFCSSLFGATLILKRFSFIGDGLSHVAFGALAVAAVTGLTAHRMIVVLPITVAAAVILLVAGQKPTVHGDAAVAMISVGALAVGYLLLHLFSPTANVAGDVCSSLFGSAAILTLSKTDVWLCVGLAVAVTVVFLVFYRRLFSVTLDEEFAAACGVKTALCRLLIAVTVAVIIVLAMNLVGSLLISALVIFPAMAALRVCRSFRGVIVCSAVISVICAASGLLLSILLDWPVGPTVVAADLIAYGIFCLIPHRAG